MRLEIGVLPSIAPIIERSRSGGHRFWARKFTDEEFPDPSFSIAQYASMGLHNYRHGTADLLLETYQGAMKRRGEVKRNAKKTGITGLLYSLLLPGEIEYEKELGKQLEAQADLLNKDMDGLPSNIKHTHDF